MTNILSIKVKTEKRKLIMNNTKITRAIGGIDDELIERAAPKNNTHRKINASWLKWAIPAAACLVLTAALVIPMLNNNENIYKDFNLVMSTGVNLRHIDDPPQILTSFSLVDLTEEELFSDWVGTERVIFEGTIKKVDNIEMSFSGGMLWYRAIAQIEIGDVYRGNIESGSIIYVLLHSPVGRDDVWVSDSSVSSQMTEGTTGIFLPTRYKEDSVMTWDGDKNILYWQEVAQFGFGDGERHAFLDKPDGVVFSRWAYKSILDFESIEGEPTMDEVRQYVISMIEKYQ